MYKQGTQISFDSFEIYKPNDLKNEKFLEIRNNCIKQSFEIIKKRYDFGEKYKKCKNQVPEAHLKSHELYFIENDELLISWINKDEDKLLYFVTQQYELV